MRKLLQGIAFILFGILLCVSEETLNDWVTHSITVPWGLLGVALGVLGLVIFLMNPKDEGKK